MGDLPVLAWRRLTVIAVGVVAGLVLLAGRYGPHRDELYFIAAGHHPAWGYPDQPPLTPLLAALADVVAPGNVTVLRLPSACCVGILVVVVALIARELGGGPSAQLFTALVTATAGVVTVIGHLLSTSTLDTLLWVLACWCALRALRTDDRRWWLIVGVIVGVGLENKFLIGLLAAGLAIGLIAHPASRRHWGSPWLWAGVIVAVAVAEPTVMWQATHGWPQMAVGADISQEYRSTTERVLFVVQQLVMISPIAGVLWVFGLWRLCRDPDWRFATPVVIAFGVLFGWFLFTGGKGYYLTGLILTMVAAGCVSLTRTLTIRAQVAAATVLVGVAIAALPIGLPLLSARDFATSVYAGPGEDQLETIGWPAVSDQVRSLAASLPHDLRSHAVVVTQNYGEAGALTYYRVGLPVYSGHNGWGLWGPPQRSSAVITVGLDSPSTLFTGCHTAGRLETGVDNEENGRPLFVCDHPRGSWTTIWPQLTHLDG